MLEIIMNWVSIKLTGLSGKYEPAADVDDRRSPGVLLFPVRGQTLDGVL